MRRARKLRSKPLLSSIILVVLATIVVLAAGCGGTTTTAGQETTTTGAATTAPPTTAAPAGGTFTIAIQPQYKAFDPAHAAEIDGLMVNFATYDTLVRSDNGKIIPWIATSWESPDNGKTYIFKLRKDVVFNSGNPLTAEDVRFSFMRLKNVKGNPSSQIDPLESIEVIDDYTVKMTLSDVDVSWLSRLTVPVCAITDSKVVKEHGGTDEPGADQTDKAQAWLDQNSAGSGPYTLVEYVNKQQAVLVRNEKYWGPNKPQFDKIVLKQIDDVNTQKLLLEKGEVDLAINLTSDQARELKNNPNVKLTFSPTLDFFYIVGNRDPAVGGPAANPKVIQAIRFALDYDGLRAVCGEGAITPYSVIPVGMLGAKPANLIKQDLEKAKALMAEAGYPDGFSADLEIPALTISSVDFTLAAQKIQEDLAKIGIKLEIKPLEVGVFLERYRGGKLGMAVSMWGPDYPDPQSQMAFLPGQRAAKNYGWKEGADPELEQLRVEAATTLDEAKRIAILEKIQERLAEVGPYVVFAQPSRYYGTTPKVGELKVDPVYMLDLAALTKS